MCAPAHPPAPLSARHPVRWQVHGTDVATGQRMTLALDEPEATHAVQAALSKRIIVSHVTRESLRRALLPITCAAIVVLSLVCAGLYWHTRMAGAELELAMREQAKTADALTQAENVV